MQFNAEKFRALRYRFTNASQLEFIGAGSTAVPESQTVIDLGISICNDASFHVHIAKVAAKCRQLVGWTLKTFRTRDQEVMLIQWKTFVLSRLDYCFQLWPSSSVKLIMELAIQLHYTKKFATVQQMTYRKRPNEPQLYFLERRRERYVTISIWKVMKGLETNFGIKCYIKTRTWRHCIVLKVISKSSNIRIRYSNSLGFRAPKCFPKLCQNNREIYMI